MLSHSLRSSSTVFVLVLWLYLFYFILRSLKLEMMWKYGVFYIFFSNGYLVVPITIYQKFHFFLSHIHYNFNHRTNDMNLHIYGISICSILFHISFYFYAAMNCVIVKAP